MTSLRLLLFVGLIPLVLAGCDAFERDFRGYDDDPKLEFKPLTQTVDEGAGTVTAQIQLIGPQRSSDLAVNFSVADSSTAQSGTHFSVGSTSATIPANSSSTNVNINVLDNNVDDGDTNYELFLNLQDSQGVEAAENLKTFTLTIRGTDEG